MKSGTADNLKGIQPTGLRSWFHFPTADLKIDNKAPLQKEVKYFNGSYLAVLHKEAKIALKFYLLNFSRHSTHAELENQLRIASLFPHQQISRIVHLEYCLTRMKRKLFKTDLRNGQLDEELQI